MRLFDAWLRKTMELAFNDEILAGYERDGRVIGRLTAEESAAVDRWLAENTGESL